MRAVLPLLVLFLIRLAPGISFQSAAVAAPVLSHALGLNHAQLGLALGTFMLPGIVVTVPAGLLARRIGDRFVLCGGFALVAAGAVLASQSGGFAALLAGRALGGAGGVAILMLTIKMVTDRYAGPWLSTASAIIITSWPASLALGLLLLGPVPARLGWRATLFLAALPALLAILLIPFVGHAATQAAKGSAATPSRAPPLRFVLGAVLSWSLMNAVLAVLVGFLPGYFVSLGRPIETAAATASLAVWTSAAAIPFGGLLADRLLGRRMAVILGVTATGCLALAVPATGGAILLMVLLGLAFAVAPGSLTAQLGQATPAASRAVVFGWYSAGSYAAMTVAPPIAGWLRDLTNAAGAPIVFAAACSFAALASYALMIAGVPARRPNLATPHG